MPDPSIEARLRAVELMQNQLPPEVQQRLDEAQAARTVGLANIGITPDSVKLLQETSTHMQAIARAQADQQASLTQTLQIQKQTADVTKELQELEAARSATQEKYSSMSQSEIARKAKQLELTKQEDAVLQKARGRLGVGAKTFGKDTPEGQTIERVRSALQAKEILETTGLSPQEAARAGGISGHDASILMGGPERAKRIAGIPISEGLGGITSTLIGNPVIKAVLGGLALGRGLEGMESTGISGVFSQIPIIGGTLAGIVNQIPGLQAATAFGATTRLGQVTGGGYKAGIGAQFDAFKMGANPFDIVSNEAATQIVSGARNAGFQGSMARAFESAMLDVYKQTGIDPATLASIGTLFAKQGQGGLDQFRSTMENIDNIARDSSQSVQNVADQIQTLSQALSGTGAAPLGLAGSIVAAVSTVAGHLTPEQQKSLATGFFGQPGMERFSGFPGVTATTAIGRRIAERNQRMFLQGQKQVLQGMPKQTQDLMLANLVQQGIFGSVDEARAAIFHGHQIIHRQSVETRRGNARNAFAEAQHGVDSLLASHPGLHDAVQFGTTEPGRVGHLYLNRLERNLRASGFNARQIQAITSPLNRVMSGSRDQHDWASAITDARKRAIMQSEAGKDQWWSGGASNQGRFLSIKLDAGETRKLYSGKAVQKRIRLANSRDGSNTTVGTSFSDGG